jgi:hypothetical protein
MTAVNYGFTIPFTIARKVADVARIGEAAGWEGLFVGDAIWCPDPMIALAAAAMVTERIRLGTMVTPMPIRNPYKLASESAALDNLSSGRMILSLGAGAVWMGWQAFPDEVTDTKMRAEMLDEGIDILTLLYKGKQFDYDGKHFHIKLTRMDEVHYPPRPVQQPRIPLWVVGVWPRKNSMQRILKCDGLLPAKMNREGQFEEVKPSDVQEMKAFIDANRTLETPFDIVIEGKTGDMSQAQAQDTICPWVEAGMTWWIESLYGMDENAIIERIRRGPAR